MKIKRIIALCLIVAMLIVLLCVLPIQASAGTDPTLTMMYTAITWENAAKRANFANNAIAKVAMATTEAELDASAVSLAKTEFAGVLSEAQIKSAFLTYAKARPFAKAAYFRLVINGCDGISDDLSLFSTIKNKINVDITGNESDNRGLQFALLFMQMVVQMDVGGSVIGTICNHSSSGVDFFVRSDIPTDRRNIAIEKINSLFDIIPDFSSAALSTYAVDPDVSISGIPNSDNILGKFMTYTAAIVNAAPSEQINAFCTFLRKYSPVANRKMVYIVNDYPGNISTPTATPPATPIPTSTPRPPSGNAGSAGANPTPTATPFAIPTPAEANQPTPTPTEQPGTITGGRFKDIPKSMDWALAPIERMAGKGYLKGVTSDMYDPTSGLKRGDIAVIMDRIFTLPMADELIFQDVPANSYYADAIKRAYQAKYINGISADEYKPEATISRQDFMTIMSRALVAQGFYNVPEDLSILEQFGDEDEIAEYARPYVALLVIQHLIIGDNANHINPTNTINRAEAAVLMDRVMTAIKK